MEIAVARLQSEAVLPTRAHPGDAGLDLYACEAAHIGPGERWSVGTGIAVEIPAGHAGLVLPRSGLAREHGIALVNSPGLIDSGYRGEVRVLLLNTDPAEIFRVAAGDRIAQLVLIVPVAIAEPVEVGRAERVRPRGRAASAPAAAEPRRSGRTSASARRPSRTIARSTVARSEAGSSSIALAPASPRGCGGRLRALAAAGGEADQGAAAVVGVGVALDHALVCSRSPTVCAIDCGRTRSEAARSLTLRGPSRSRRPSTLPWEIGKPCSARRRRISCAEHDPQLAGQ